MAEAGVVNGVCVDPKAYFFGLIRRREGEDASDWQQVLKATSMPDGYGPNFVPSFGMPFYGLTMMGGAGGPREPRGRIFLPTAAPDGEGYFTRQIQVIADKPGGVQGRDFVWAWDYISGHEYAALQPPNRPDTPDVPDRPEVPVRPEHPVRPEVPDASQEVAKLTASVAALEGKLAALEGKLAALDLTEALKQLEVLVDVIPAGPDNLRILGQQINLSHDHGVEVVLKVGGHEVQRVRSSAKAEASVTPVP